MKTGWIFLMMLFFPVLAFAQKRHLNKAWEYLDKKQFTNARTEIDAFMEKEPEQPMGYFALAKWLNTPDNPLCNPDEAFAALKKSLACFETGKEKKSVSSDPLFKQYTEMMPAVRLLEDSIVQAAYTIYARPNTIESFALFETRYAGYPQAATARAHAAHLAFNQALAEKSIAALDSFIAQNPGAKDIPLARKKIEQMEFERARTLGKIDGLEKFLDKYPHTEYLDSAQQLIYEIAFEAIRYNGKAADFKQYLSRYPLSPMKSMALKKLWKAEFDAAAATENPEALRAFREEYPEAPEAAGAKALEEKLYWDKAKSSERTADIENFLSRYPQSSYLNEAKALLVSLSFRSATHKKDTTTLKSLMLQYPDAPEAVAARAMLDSLQKAAPNVPSVPKSNTAAPLGPKTTPKPAGPIAKKEGIAPLAEVTTNVIVTANPAIVAVPSAATAIIWGPYTLSCSGNPVAEVPEFSPLFIGDEKDLLDYIVKSCTGSVNEAVDALTDLLLNAEDLRSKMAATSADINAVNAAQKAKDAKKAAAESQKKLKTSAAEAFKKSKDLYENMVKLTAGIELYAAACMWDGFKEFTTDKLPEDLQKVKKATEEYNKAKQSLVKKMEDFQKLATGAPTQPLDPIAYTSLYADWKDIQNGIKTSSEGLGLLFSYINDPVKILPYESQLTYALENIDGKMATLMTDCKIRECDLLLRNGITAGQQALTAARKHYAYMRKGEDKWKERIYQLQKNYNWMLLPAEFASAIPGWDTWYKYKTEAQKADKKRKAIEKDLSLLGTYCARLEPISRLLNERIDKYELLYSKGLIAIENCKLDEATAVIKQLRALETGDCSHFFPRPYDIAKSDALQQRLSVVKEEGGCIKIPAGSYILANVEVIPSNDDIIRTQTTISCRNYDDKNMLDYRFTLQNSLPEFIAPGTKIKLDFSAECPNPNPKLDFFVRSWWKSDIELQRSYYGYTDKQIMVGLREGKIIPSASGSLTIEVPSDGGKELYLKISVGFAFEGSIHEWLVITYRKN